MFTLSHPLRPTLSPTLSLLAAFLLAASPVALLAQKADPPGQQQTPPTQQPMGGASTGTALVSVARRTVGIVDPKAPKVFEDVTTQTGLQSFKHRSGGALKDYIVETVSGGVAVFDYDNDSRPDIYLLNGSTIDAMKG